MLISAEVPEVQNFIFKLINEQLLSLDYAKCVNQIQRLQRIGFVTASLQLYKNQNVMHGDVYMTKGKSELYIFTFLSMWALS